MTPARASHHEGNFDLTKTGKQVPYSWLVCTCRGSSVVEREPEELSVVGSIPTPGTTLRLRALFF